MLPVSTGKDNKAILSRRIFRPGGVLKSFAKTKLALFYSTLALKPVGHGGDSMSFMNFGQGN